MESDQIISHRGILLHLGPPLILRFELSPCFAYAGASTALGQDPPRTVVFNQSVSRS